MLCALTDARGGGRYSSPPTPCSPPCPKDLLQWWRCTWGCPFHRGRSGAGGGPGAPHFLLQASEGCWVRSPLGPAESTSSVYRSAPAYAEERARLSGRNSPTTLPSRLLPPPRLVWSPTSRPPLLSCSFMRQTSGSEKPRRWLARHSSFFLLSDSRLCP